MNYERVVVLWNDIYLTFPYHENIYSMKMSYELTVINTNVILHAAKLIAVNTNHESHAITV
jgi:hypothetical protein